MKKALILLTVLMLAVSVAGAKAPMREVIGSCEFDAASEDAGTDNPGIKEGTGCVVDSSVGWFWPTTGSYGGYRDQVAVVWEDEYGDTPNNFGRFAEITIAGKKGMTPTRIDIEFLAGVANDDFCVLVWAYKSSAPEQPDHYVSIDCADEDENNTDEAMMMKTMFLPGMVFHPGQDITVQLRATGNGWSSRSTYGQVAIRKITVWGTKGKVQQN
jgi:hypothetical protein